MNLCWQSCPHASRFIQRPEYLTPNTRFVFREGRTKGIGIVMETEHEFKETTEALLARAAAASAAAIKERKDLDQQSEGS